MNTVIVGVVLLVVAAVVLLKIMGRSRQQGQRSAPPTPARATSPSKHPAPAPEARPAAAPPVPPLDLPMELQAFQRTTLDQLTPERKAELTQRLSKLPRPPQSLQRLVSPDFVQTATSMELSELVLGEPQVAAKVLATVNSPLYGLRQPVVSLGQGITFLGLNTVRGICVRYMLDHAFPASDPATKRAFDRMWQASALASELCVRLAPRIGLRDAGALVTQVVLSFLGHQAALALLNPDQIRAVQGQNLLERTRLEQEWLGLGSAELGRLLMQAWALPATIVSSVHAVDQWLEAGPTQGPGDDGAALCYLCARLGEKLAFGHWTDLTQHPLAEDDSLDLAQAKHWLLARHGTSLSDALAAPELQHALQPMLPDTPGSSVT